MPEPAAPLVAAPPGPSFNEDEVFVFPASFAQQRLWFLDQFEPGSPYYNIPTAVRLDGPLDLGAFEATIQEIIRRHESLRTTFARRGGDLVQVVSPELRLAVPVVDLSGLPASERDAEANRLVREEACRPFDLARGPLLRILLLRLDAQRHIVALTMHHVVSDGWSMGVLVSEIAAIYAALTQGLPSPLPELPVQYGDYSEWQQERMRSGALRSQLDYWKRQLAGEIPVLRLPSDRPRPAIYTSRGASLSVTFPRELTDGLTALARQEGGTLFMVLAAGFAALLHRYTSQTDITLGTPVAGRNRAEIEGLIGCFINTLVLRADLSGGPSFRELLRQVRETTLDAYANQDVPFEMLVDALQPERAMSHTPLFQVMLILQNAPVAARPVPGLSLRQLEIHTGTSTFDLTLSIAESGAGLEVSAEFNTDLFDEATIASLLAHFQVLLRGAVHSPGLSLSRLPLLTGGEERKLLLEWNDTTRPYRLDQCIHELIEAQAAIRPDAIAVSVPALETAGEPAEGTALLSPGILTYRDLNRNANQLAHYLRKLGVRPEMPVGICLERSLAMIVSVLGVLKAGGAYLPLDPSYPSDRLQHMLSDSKVEVVLTQRKLLSLLPESAARAVCVEDWTDIGGEAGEDSSSAATPANLAYIIYTSGSTGQSKGVMVQHRSLVNACLAWEDGYRLDSTHVHLQMAAFSFDVFSGDLVRALSTGGKLVLCPREILLDPARLLEVMHAEKVNTAEFVPAVLRQAVQHLEQTGDSLDFFRLLICGSDAWFADEYRRFRRLCGPDTRLINSFGLTEAAIDSSYFESESVVLSTGQMVPIGRPFANTRLYVLNERLELAPRGVPGELCVAGPNLARGYLSRPDLTAGKFVPDPFAAHPGERLYRTGDQARFLPDGNLELLGRLDSQVKIRGCRIETGEIESVLGQHAAVRQAVVIPQDGASGLKSLVAYVQPHRDATVAAAELRRFALEKLPEYMVPAGFQFVDSLPLAPNGKVDRNALPPFDWSQIPAEEDYVAPRTPVEEMLAFIWMQVLGARRVGVHDNFFALGGHSLLATQVISRIRDAFQVELPLRHVFEAPTVATLAERVEIARRAGAGLEAPPVRRVPRDRNLPLSFAQQRLWFLDQLVPASAFYNIPESVRLYGPLDVAALERSLNEIARRHEILRTTFILSGDEPVQKIGDWQRFALTVTSLEHLPLPERETEALRLVREEARHPFDLARGPLFRVRLLRLSGQDHVMVLVLHHIVSDDWSSRVLVREVSILYEAFRAGRPSPLSDLSVQYADFACWQREWLRGEVLQSHLDYWRGQLEGAPPELELATDRPRPAVQTFDGAYETMRLPPELSEKVRLLARREGVTLFMTLLAAFQTLLSRWSGQEDICVGAPIANRNRAELEPLIGFFVNTLVLRTDLSGDPTFRELLARVRQTTLGAYAHQDLPFEMLVDALQPERNLGHSPLFQAMFALQNNPSRIERLPGANLQLGPFEAHSGTAKFDLTAFAIEDADQLGFAFEYNTALFDASTIRGMLEQFRTLLESIVADAGHRLSALEYIPEADRRRLIHGFNQTAAEFPGGSCVHELFEEQVERTPAAIAAVCGEQAITYAELNVRSNQLAHYLRSLGAGAESRVGVCMERSVDLLVALLGVLKAGAAYVPLDPGYPSQRLSFLIEDSGMSLLLTESGLRHLLTGESLSTICLDTGWPAIARQSMLNPGAAASPDNLCYVIYTSGSTGLPKGVMVTHRGLLNYLTWCRQAYPLDGGEGAPVSSSIAFDLTVTGLFGPLTAGRCVALMGEGLAGESLTGAVRARRGYSLIKITPAHLKLLAGQLTPEEARGAARALVIGGENLLPEHISFWQEHAPDTALINEYGPTETVVGCCVYQVPPGTGYSGAVPIGRPIINTQLYVLDTHLRPVPQGVRGELFIGGAGVARGYLNRPDLTAECFLPDPFSDVPGARLYRSGDMVRLRRDGNLECLGRADEQVKIRGFRIELGEVEAALAQHPDVEAAALVARDAILGEKELAAYCVPANGAELSAAALKAFLAERLPEFMIPAVYVPMESLPLTPNGKIDRRALPAPSGRALPAASAFVAPRTATEETLAMLWAGLLGVDQVGAADSFFDLGGHSLLATRLAARVREAFATELPLQAIFENPTLEGQARCIEEACRVARGLAAPPIVPVSRQQDLRLSYAQERLWFLEQLEPGTSLHNIPSAARLSGSLEVAAFEWAVNEVIRRHEVLRTAFAAVDGKPVQRVVAELDVSLPFVDLSHLGEPERGEQVRRHIAEEARHPFRLDEPPLLRARLLRLAGDEHIVVLVMHHIASDGWSTGVLLQEIAALYEARLRGLSSPLSPLPVQYADYAEWERNWLQGDTLQRQIEFWKQELNRVPLVLDLPADRLRPTHWDVTGDTLVFHLELELKEQLVRLGRREGVTLYMTLLAAFQTLLHRYSGQDRFCVGTPSANRGRREIEGLIGFFANTLVMTADCSGEPAFLDLLRRVRQTVLAALSHQDVPFETLVEALQPERDTSRNPVFQVMFAYQSSTALALKSSTLSLSTLEAESGVAKFDLSLSVIEHPSGLSGELEFSTALFDRSSMERMAEHFRVLLEAIAAHPDCPISELPILPPCEEARLLHEWNSTQAPFPERETFAGLFRRQAAGRPDLAALYSSSVQWSYRELNSRSNQLARRLARRGTGPESLVAICLERSAEMVLAIVSVLKAGAAYLPLDPSLPDDRILFMLQDSEPALLLTRAGLAARFERARVPPLCLDTEWEQVHLENEEDFLCPAGPDNLAYVIYTSGSTGRPKGTLLGHRGLTNFLAVFPSLTAMSTGSRVLQFASVGFDASITELLAPLVSGACVCVPESGHLLAGANLEEVMRQHEATHITLPPSILRQLHPDQLPGVQCVVSAGEACTPEIVERWGPHCLLLNGYGPTECTVGTTYVRLDRSEGGQTRVPVGRPVANARVYVLDRRLQPVPIGVPGELFVGGPGVARGYLNRPDLTAGRFIPDPFGGETGARLCRTGDLVRYRADGQLEFLARIDRQVKLRGFRIELEEIEEVVRKQPGVVDAVVTVRGGPGRERLVAYYVEPADRPVQVEPLRSGLRQWLPDSMVPASFVKLETLPLTPSGKVDRQALPEPDSGPLAGSAGFVAPRNEEEELVSAVWRQILGIEKIGVTDDFFRLGGHSLLAVQVISRVNHIFSVDVPLRALFEAPTIAGFLEQVDHARRSAGGLSVPLLRPVPRDSSLPLSFAQQRLWFLDQLEPGTPLYNISNAVRLSGALDVEAFEWSVNEVVRRHELLRTNFVSLDGRACLRIAPELRISLAVEDLSSLGEAVGEARLAEIVAAEAQRPFNLAEDPLLRIRLLRLGPEEHVASFTMHHIVSDGWSASVLIKELALLYAARASRQPVDLPELPIQYADYAAWERSWLQGPVLEQKLEYWKVQLKGLPPVLDLPLDRPRPRYLTFRGSTSPITIPETLAHRLADLGNRQSSTLFMTLLAAFETLLFRYSGAEDFAVGTPSANRNRTEVEGLVGFFVNTLVMRADFSDDPDFCTILERVRATALGVYAHQDVPFEMVVDAVQPERSMSHSPLFQVMFVFQNLPQAGHELPGLRIRPLATDGATAKFDLTLTLAGDRGGLQGSFEYNTDLFEGTTISRMAQHFRNLLEDIVSDPLRPVSRLRLLSAGERAALVKAKPAEERAGAACLHEMVETQALRTPGAVALTFEGRHLSYGGLNARANQLSHYLRHVGVTPGSLVAILMERSLDMVVAMLAVLKCGAAYLPIDPAYPPDRAAFMLEDARASLLLTKGLEREQIPAKVPVACLDDIQQELSGFSADNPPRLAGSQYLAYVIYTSGSTGRPKGVMVTHTNVVRLLKTTEPWFHFCPADVWTLFHSCAFDFSVWEIWGALCYGGRLVVVPYLISRSPEAFYDLLVREQVTVLNQTPSAFRQLAQAEEASNSLMNLALRLVIFGGEALDLQSLRPWFNRHGDERPVMVNMYGITETTVHVTYRPIRHSDLERAPGSVIGEPIPDLQVYVLDANMALSPPGVCGELYVGGAGLARGYLGRPDLTADRFVPHPFAAVPGERVYRTGDLARLLLNGELAYLGRIDHQVKVRGFRVELGEIESALTQHESVRQAVALLREDHPGRKRITAYVVPAAGAPFSLQELRVFAQRKLPDYMMPAAFVALESLPLTSNGKIDPRALPPPSAAVLETPGMYVAPRTREEKLLAGIWAKTLGLERVGARDNFFELGGDSILSIQVISQMNRAGLRITPRQFFEQPTVEALAVAAGEAPPALAEQGVITGPVPLTPIQRWFFEHHPDHPHHFNTSMFLESPQPLRPDLLERASRELQAHHDALRLRFETTPEGWRQINEGSRVDSPFVYRDFSTLGRTRLRKNLEQGAAEIQCGLRLDRAPLWRLAYFDLGPARGSRLLLLFHHLVLDGVSWRIVVEDLGTLYQQLLQGESPKLPLKTTSYRHWAMALEEYAGSPHLHDEFGIWRDATAGDSPLLPPDRRDGPNTYGSTAVLDASLPEAITAVLLQQAPVRLGATAEEVLLLGLARAMFRETGRPVLTLEMEGHGREDVLPGIDLSRTVGWFTSIFPLRLSLDPSIGMREQLTAIGEQLRRVPRRGFNYGVLRYLSPDPAIRQALGSRPAPWLNFNYLGQFDHLAVAPGLPLRLAREAPGPEQHSQSPRGAVLNVVAIVTGGRLGIRWIYSRNLHNRATISRLSRTYMSELQELAEICNSH